MKKPFVPFDQFERSGTPDTKSLHDTMQENCNDRLAPVPDPCVSPCAPYWQPTDERSCTKSALIEIQEVDGCGNTRWTRTKELVAWVNQGDPILNEETGQVSQEQVNQCGQTRTVVTTLPSSQVRHSNTSSVNLNGTGRASSPLTATVRISQDEDNLIEIREDGLYVLLPISALPANVLQRREDGLYVGLSEDEGNDIEIREDGLFYENPIIVEVGSKTLQVASSSSGTQFVIQTGSGTAPASGTSGTTVTVDFPIPFSFAPHVFAYPVSLSQAAGPIVAERSAVSATQFTYRFDKAEGDGSGEANITSPVPYEWIAFGNIAAP